MHHDATCRYSSFCLAAVGCCTLELLARRKPRLIIRTGNYASQRAATHLRARSLVLLHSKYLQRHIAFAQSKPATKQLSCLQLPTLVLGSYCRTNIRLPPSSFNRGYSPYFGSLPIQPPSLALPGRLDGNKVLATTSCMLWQGGYSPCPRTQHQESRVPTAVKCLLARTYCDDI